MSAHLSTTPITRGPITRSVAHLAPHLVLALRLSWRRFRRAYALALRDEVSRRNLRRMDDRMLADVGISRAHTQFEANRKPWHYL